MGQQHYLKKKKKKKKGPELRVFRKQEKKKKSTVAEAQHLKQEWQEMKSERPVRSSRACRA